MWDLTRAPVRPDGEGRGATYVSDRVLFTGGKIHHRRCSDRAAVSCTRSAFVNISWGSR